MVRPHTRRCSRLQKMEANLLSYLAAEPCLAPDRQTAAPFGTPRALRAGGG